MVKIVLTDEEGPSQAFEHEDPAEAFKALYLDLARRNECDCTAAIERGFISVPGGAYSPDIVLARDPDGFWQACCVHMLSGSQDFHVEAEQWPAPMADNAGRAQSQRCDELRQTATIVGRSGG